MSFRIKLNVFEGPFDLLLYLIKVNEMDIYDIPIAKITQQYLEYIHIMQALDLEVAGEFLVMAATLLNIKSRHLLPSGELLEDEEEIDEILSAKELIRQLVEYRKFKEMAWSLRLREEDQSRVFFRYNIEPILPEPEREEPLREDLHLLFSAFSRVLRYAETRDYHQVLEENITVEDKMDYLSLLLGKSDVLNLMDIFKKCLTRNETIVTFLAMLELCKRKQIRVKQSGPFKDILIYSWESQPDYV
jgi:segregation and condensation protein A